MVLTGDWGRICSQAHSCCQLILVPCSCRTEVLFPCWLSTRNPSLPREAAHILSDAFHAPLGALHVGPLSEPATGTLVLLMFESNLPLCCIALLPPGKVFCFQAHVIRLAHMGIQKNFPSQGSYLNHICIVPFTRRPNIFTGSRN